MTNPNLSVLIPVDQKMALKKDWRMPYRPLFKRFKEQSHGRVVLSDSGSPKLNSDQSVKEFLKACSEDELYLDITINEKD
jgi:hypothetical protein